MFDFYVVTETVIEPDGTTRVRKHLLMPPRQGFYFVDRKKRQTSYDEKKRKKQRAMFRLTQPPKKEDYIGGWRRNGRWMQK